MKHAINDTLTTKPTPNTIKISTHLFQALSQTDKRHWQSLFQEFRLNFQSRIAGSDERQLLKLEAKIETVNELEQFFDSVISTPPAKII